MRCILEELFYGNISLEEEGEISSCAFSLIAIQEALITA